MKGKLNNKILLAFCFPFFNRVWYPLYKFPHCVYTCDFLWSWSNEQSDSKKCFIGTKVHLTVKSNPSQVPEKSNKICTRHVGNKIRRMLSPTDKITPIFPFACERVVVATLIMIFFFHFKGKYKCKITTKLKHIIILIFGYMFSMHWSFTHFIVRGGYFTCTKPFTVFHYWCTCIVTIVSTSQGLVNTFLNNGSVSQILFLSSFQFSFPLVKDSILIRGRGGGINKSNQKIW